MLRRATKWAMRLAALAVLAAVATRIAVALSDRNGADRSPVIGGDTWPPVPTNRARD